jgi:hypothetical protein
MVLPVESALPPAALHEQVKPALTNPPAPSPVPFHQQKSKLSVSTSILPVVPALQVSYLTISKI